MRATLQFFVLLTCVSVGGFAAPRYIKLTAPKGGNTGGMSTRIQKGGEWSKNLASFRAQNKLSSTMSQQLVKEKSSAGGTFGNPNYVNGVVDTIPYFNSWFITGSRNSVYTYSMFGHSPKAGGTTYINNRILPLIIDLMDPNGNTLFRFDPTGGGACGPGSDVALTVKSPIWDATTLYHGNGGSFPPDKGQFSDTKLRASFTGVKAANWHTPLSAPQNGDCSQIIAEVFLDPTAWVYLIDTNNNIVGVAMDINVISNVYEAYLAADVAAFGTPNSVFSIILTDYLSAYDPTSGCCVLGYHTADPGKANPAGIQVWAWSTFLPPPPGNPFGGWSDVQVISHEVDEAYNDPFVNTLVAPWVDGSVSFAQANLETGDVVEAMPDPFVIYPVTVNNYNYHVQNQATLQWFTRTPAAPITGPGPGVYSWPNTNVLNNGHNPAGWVFGEGPAGFYFGPPF